MNRYLFTDSSNGILEIQSTEELYKQAESSVHPGKIRIWIFSSNEWISYAAFQKKFPLGTKKEPVSMPLNTTRIPNRTGGGKAWLKKFLFFSGAAAGVFLIFNFTKVKWTKAAPVNTTASRPDNVPLMDMDSLISEIEDERGVYLDRSTRTNLRLRNTWPDRIELRLNAGRETNNSLSRFYHVDVSVDNTTGFLIDEAMVKLSVFKNGKVNASDTVRFNNIPYDKVSSRQLNGTYRGDSIAVSFESIRAKAFNFCYSAAVKNNSGNYNDRWFCRGE